MQSLKGKPAMPRSPSPCHTIFKLPLRSKPDRFNSEIAGQVVIPALLDKLLHLLMNFGHSEGMGLVYFSGLPGCLCVPVPLGEGLLLS